MSTGNEGGERRDVSHTFVTGKDYDDVFFGISLNLLQPLRQRFERSSIREIEGEDHPLGTAIVATCNSAETLLSSSVPFIVRINK